VLIQSSADLTNRVVTVDAGDPSRLAYCAPGEIRVSADNGVSWSPVPVAGVIDVAASLDYQVFPSDSNQPAQCFSVTMDASHPDSFFAVFTTANVEFGAPPLFYMGFYTTDGGATWLSVPFPQGASLETFGGFFSDGMGAIQALHSPVNAPLGSSNVLPVLQTADGGITWNPGVLTCPPAGPCLRWGAASASIPGMGSPLPQYALASPDGGQTWTNLEPPVELRVSPPNQLVALSETGALLISGSIVYSAQGGSPVRVTEDGGAAWQEFPLPQLPDSDPAIPAYPGLQILPDGSFLSQGAEGIEWFMLSPGAGDWCQLEIADMPPFPVELPASGGNLWWVNPDDNTLVGVPLEELSCPGN
jgi:photosystem II stability/assembly factor-like uncharacterized protein